MEREKGTVPIGTRREAGLGGGEWGMRPGRHLAIPGGSMAVCWFGCGREGVCLPVAVQGCVSEAA